MCSLFGMSSATRQRASRSLLAAPRSLLAQSERNPDGWGIAARRPLDGHINAARPARLGFVTVKQPAAARDSALFQQAARESRSTVIVAHLRRRTIGAVGPANTQPFGGAAVLAHTGGIGGAWHMRLRHALGDRYQSCGATSGELLWACVEHLLLPGSGVDSSDSTVDITGQLIDHLLRPLVAAPDGILSANFVLGCGDRLYAFRFAPPGRHRLYLLQRARCVLVSSVPLTDEPWREIPERTLLTARRGDYQLTSIDD